MASVASNIVVIGAVRFFRFHREASCLVKRVRCCDLRSSKLLGSPYPRFFSGTSKDFHEEPKSLIDLASVTSPIVAERVKMMSDKHTEILASMHQDDSSALNSVRAQELSALAPVASLYSKFNDLLCQFAEVRTLKAEAMDMNDDDMIQECHSEQERIEGELQRLGESMIDLVLPKDTDDYNADAIIEVRAGTGGEEASLFSGELVGAYRKTAMAMGWGFEMLSESKTDLGGIKEAAASITSKNKAYSNNVELSPYGYFRYESGVHRVQRVPSNDVRIHTSAVSVAVLPAPSEDANDASELLPMSELKIETMRASGAGGQHVNTTESAVRITHIPTGITASIQDERSQHKNKAKALKLITARVRDRRREEEARARGETRNSLMGGGDRSERIRTYNYPQDRITDHRSKQSEYGITSLFTGDVESGLVRMFEPMLRKLHRDELIRKMEDAIKIK